MTNYIPSTFSTTHDLFKKYLDYNKPLTYEEWLNIDDSSKAAALFVQFYKEIILVWYKLGHPCVEPEEVISTIMQYLCKQVDVIKGNKTRFYPGYIYRVVYNCVYCLVALTKTNRSKYRIKWETEMSNEIVVNNNGSSEVVDIFDRVTVNYDFLDILVYKKLDQLINELSVEQQKIVQSIMSGNSKGTKKEEEVLVLLRQGLAEYV